ncbi:MAG: hypothetical protein DKT66_21400 [Candidatus Melainabacteria bacterium]|nr:MAG: hypothetical protein DKT66_21400 [Candidatus Melainabacteria bacterium]
MERCGDKPMRLCNNAACADAAMQSAMRQFKDQSGRKYSGQTRIFCAVKPPKESSTCANPA